MFNYNKRYLRKVLTAVSSLIIMVLFLPGIASAKASSDEEKSSTAIENQIIDEQTKIGETEKIEDQLNKHSDKDFKKLVPDFDPQKIISDGTKGNFQFSPGNFVNNILTYVFKEIYENINILVKLIILSVMCAVLKNLQTSFLSESVGELAFYACYVVIIGILISGFNTALNLGRDIIDSMVAFMQATIPVLITLMISGGNITSAGIFQPILIMIVQVAATVLKNVLIPLIFLYTVLAIVNNISDKVQISKLMAMIKQISSWILGIILTLFIAVVSIQGTLGAVVDGVTSKTAKFAIGAFIPVAGKYLADAADAVIGCTLLIKNAAGVGAMIGILSICIIPMLKIFAIMALYKLACVILEPIAEKRITNCINDIAGSLTHIIGIIASVALMFLISITAIISASNISAMMR